MEELSKDLLRLVECYDPRLSKIPRLMLADGTLLKALPRLAESSGVMCWIEVIVPGGFSMPSRRRKAIMFAESSKAPSIAWHKNGPSKSRRWRQA